MWELFSTYWEPGITFFLLAICVAIFFIRYHELPQYCKYAGIIALFHLVFYAFTAYLMYNETNNMLLFHILKPLQYAVTVFFLVEVVSNPRIKRILLVSAPTFILLSIYFSFAVQTITAYNSYSILVYNSLVIIGIMLLFRDLLTNPNIRNLLAYPAFWISIGLLFYCVGTTFSEGLMNYLIQRHREYALSYYYIGIVLSFFLYCFIIVGFLCDKLFREETREP